MQQRRILVTSALPYANAPLHLGHILEAVQTDIWVRFQKLRGNECYYVCADDAHGTAIMLRAEENGISAEEHIAKIKELHEQDFQNFLVEVDNYYSTHSEENRKLSESIYLKLRDNGDIVCKTITQAFDPEKELFLADRFIKGSCPKCKTPDQYGDNCEACGATYSPSDLIDAVSTISGSKPVDKESEHYFFDLPKFHDFLSEWLSSGSLQPEISKKLSEWLDAGLQSWDISRDAPYFGFEIPDAPNKYFYVWLDAPIGYMASFTNFAEKANLSFDQFWKDQTSTELYHFIGKDIINFHGLFWPAMLKSAGYRLPNGVFAHGFVTVNGTKMSKSRGTFINAATYLKHLPAEPLRYYYASKLGNGVEDIDLNFEDFVQKVNSDLVGKVVNIASRCSGFIHRLNDGVLSSDIAEPALWAEGTSAGERIAECYEKREFAKAMREIMAVADSANEYIAEKAPWTLAKNPEKVGEAIDICSMGINLFRLLVTYLKPVLPQIADASETFLATPIRWDGAIEPLEAHKIEKFQPLMQRIELSSIEAIVEESKQSIAAKTETAKTTETKPVSEENSDSNEITIDDFNKVELKVGRIVDANYVDGADQLLQLTVDLGDHQRNIFSGIRKFYDPTTLIGRQTVVVTNLKPRKMRFGVSEGMVLCAADKESLYLLDVDSDAAPGMAIS